MAGKWTLNEGLCFLLKNMGTVAMLGLSRGFLRKVLGNDGPFSNSTCPAPNSWKTLGGWVANSATRRNKSSRMHSRWETSRFEVQSGPQSRDWKKQGPIQKNYVYIHLYIKCYFLFECIYLIYLWMCMICWKNIYTCISIIHIILIIYI